MSFHGVLSHARWHCWGVCAFSGASNARGRLLARLPGKIGILSQTTFNMFLFYMRASSVSVSYMSMHIGILSQTTFNMFLFYMSGLPAVSILYLTCSHSWLKVLLSFSYYTVMSSIICTLSWQFLTICLLMLASWLASKKYYESERQRKNKDLMITTTVTIIIFASQLVWMIVKRMLSQAKWNNWIKRNLEPKPRTCLGGPRQRAAACMVSH